MEDFKVVCIAVSERRSTTKRYELNPASMGMWLSSDTEGRNRSLQRQALGMRTRHQRNIV